MATIVTQPETVKLTFTVQSATISGRGIRSGIATVQDQAEVPLAPTIILTDPNATENERALARWAIEMVRVLDLFINDSKN